MRYLRLIILIFIIFTNNCYAGTVGFLSTTKETYPHETGYSDNIIKMLEGLGAKTALIDYNSLAAADGDLSNKVKKFIRDNDITHVIIPGNYYNMSSPPYPPTSNRQDVTEVITQIADEGTIYLMGICGGLQGIAHSKGIEIVSVADLNGDTKQHISADDKHPHSSGVPLSEVRIDPASRIAKILENSSVKKDKNGWIILSLPDAHSQVLNNSLDNKKKIEELGYKIVGFADDGMIEIIEDKLGNIHFQSHPEGLVINRINDKNISPLRDMSIDATVAIFKDFINRK